VDVGILEIGEYALAMTADGRAKVIVALAETARLMEEIDKAIPSWPIT